MTELVTGSKNALAIAMWDFSWLERRWPGGGYEDWGRALDELVERGYDVVRIDAYPHLVAEDPGGSFTLVPAWVMHDWGAPFEVTVSPMPALVDFIRLADARGLKVALSTWFRRDVADTRMKITGPEVLADIWVATLDHIRDAGLLDALWYVDLCNEWPQLMWAPFTSADGDDPPAEMLRTSTEGQQWTNTALDRVRRAYPHIPLCFSISAQFDTVLAEDVSHYDLLEPHVWMVLAGPRNFYEEFGYDGSDPGQYELLAAEARRLYESSADEWRIQLSNMITDMADWSRWRNLPLVTTESWAIVCWKDGPGLEWGWVKDLCEFGVDEAIKHERWRGIATSNFCGPQYVGMWEDVAWHVELTTRIHDGALSLSSVGERGSVEGS
ncbi:cellulase [Diaminobutyricibacter tongyongensis]|uniref:Cellulase n=1 Tax=Leifsonia tongyongensis TaxID=1268043 RepID=A0A6L9XWJ9_9MICO|nr:cellulase-like family protein [Diaminobutyricibacter tongyongensis]NEN05414.1 cellulase [Diaminobutyricibacter tongyongensis]